MDETTLKYFEEHFKFLSTVDKFEIAREAVLRAASSEVTQDNLLGVLQHLSDIEAACRRMRKQ